MRRVKPLPSACPVKPARSTTSSGSRLARLVPSARSWVKTARCRAYRARCVHTAEMRCGDRAFWLRRRERSLLRPELSDARWSVRNRHRHGYSKSSSLLLCCSALSGPTSMKPGNQRAILALQASCLRASVSTVRVYACRRRVPERARFAVLPVVPARLVQPDSKPSRLPVLLGQFNQTGASDSSRCSAQAGTFANATGMLSCLQCPRGFYQGNVGATGCCELFSAFPV